MGIEPPNAPDPPRVNAIAAPVVTPPQPPTKAAAPQPQKAPALAITCMSDDIAMRSLPSRKITEKPDTRGKYSGGDEWFPSQTEIDKMKPLPVAIPRGKTQAIAYIYGSCFFEDAAEALATASTADHRIYIAGWATELRVALGRSGMLQDILQNTRAQVRGLFWVAGIGTGLDNSGTVRAIQSLANGAALLDAQLPPVSAHHQKILIVQGDQGLIAFLGGMDFMYSRVAINPSIGEPWSDVHLRLIGPAADDVRQIFQNRWLFHPGTRTLDEKLGLSWKDSSDARRDFAFPPAKATSPAAFGTVTAASNSERQTRRQVVAIGRTFAKTRQGNPTLYSFAPGGDFSAWSLIETGIQRAKRWIYLEDQYLVSRMARQALLAKLKNDPKFEFLLMVMNNSGGLDFKYAVTARNEFRQELLKLDPNKKKWGLYTIKTPADPARQAWCGSYLHSKIWIFDDGYSIIGSANCDNRGYTLDSEVVAGIADASDTDLWLGRNFAIDLRTRLWSKYLGLPHDKVSYFSEGLKYWKTPPPGAMVVENSGYEDDPMYTPPAPFPDASTSAGYEFLWTHLLDPDAR